MFIVADMMTPHPITLSPTHTLANAQSVMREHDIHHLPITDDDNIIVGIISQRDILAAQESQLELHQHTHALTHPIEDVMNTDIMSVTPYAGLKEAALYMQKHKIGCLPVVDKKKLVGIITDTDFVAIAINLLEIQEEIEPLEESDAIF